MIARCSPCARITRKRLQACRRVRETDKGKERGKREGGEGKAEGGEGKAEGGEGKAEGGEGRRGGGR